MNKRIMSFVMVFLMLFGMMATAVPAYAADTEAVTEDLTITAVADKATAKPGDTITYTVKIGPHTALMALAFELDIPAGLTYVVGSAQVPDTVEDTLGASVCGFEEDTLFFLADADYTSEEELTIMTFQCTVDAGATGTLTLGFKPDEDVNNYNEADNLNLVHVPASVTVETAAAKALESIAVTTAPTKTAYTAGEDFDPAGMVVTAYYTDDTSAAVTTYTVTDGAALTAGKTAVTISYTEGDVTKTATQAITVAAPKLLNSIAVVKMPTKTVYIAGEDFDPTGMVVNAIFRGGIVEPITDYIVTDGTALTAGKKNVTISYTYGTVTKTTKVTITVNAPKVLDSIAVTTAPTKTTYTAGEDFDPAGMVVTAYYTDDTSAAVTTYTVTDGTALTEGKTSVTISYTYGGVTKTATQAITVNAPVVKALDYIEITTAPTKTTYIAGEDFDPAGMVVTAYYTDNTSAAVTTYTVTDGAALTEGKADVTISYTEDGVTKTATQTITVTAPVVKALDYIEITTAPTKTAYIAGEDFDPAGMVVTAYYTDDTSAAVTVYTVTDGAALTEGKTTVTISYTEDGVTKTATQAITVSAPAVVVKTLESIAVTTAPTKTAYIAGENFDPAGMVVTATYSDGTTAAVTTYTVTDGDGLAEGKADVTISYTEDGVTKTATQAITVSAPVTPDPTVPTITFGANGGTGSMDAVSVPVGSVYILPANGFTAPAGKQFAYWNVNGRAVYPGTAIVVTADTVITAVWKNSSVPGGDWYWGLIAMHSKKYDISAVAGEGGAISPAGVSQVKYSKSITYTITPDNGYEIKAVLVDGKDVGAVSEYTFKNVKKAHTIEAVFASTNPYTDIKAADWYYEDITYVTGLGLMNGTGAGKFDPLASTDRAMLVTILWRLEGSPVVENDEKFSDVEADTWYTAAVDWAAVNGIVNGYGNGEFGPEDKITREQIMAILNRYAAYKQWTADSARPLFGEYTYSEWAEANVIWAENTGLLDNLGANVSDMTAEASRAELAAYLHRFCKNTVDWADLEK